jgi:hypothetical protein
LKKLQNNILFSNQFKNLKGIVSRDKEGVLLIPVYSWDVCRVSLSGLKFLKCCFPFKFLKRREFTAGHFHITTQLPSVNPQDY